MEQHDQFKLTIRSLQKETLNLENKAISKASAKSQSSDDIEISDNNEDDCHICISKLLHFIY